MVEDRFERSWNVDPAKIKNVWETLQTREFFVDGQIFPYRVEFDASEQKGGFETGELNIHHGPLLSVHGVIGEITPTYRDLKYFYGSYAISFRLVRPTRLQMSHDGQTLTIKIYVYVRPWFRGLWRTMNRVFWTSFGMWIRKEGQS